MRLKNSHSKTHTGQGLLFLCAATCSSLYFMPIPPWTSNITKEYDIWDVLLVGSCSDLIWFIQGKIILLYDLYYMKTFLFMQTLSYMSSKRQFWLLSFKQKSKLLTCLLSWENTSWNYCDAWAFFSCKSSCVLYSRNLECFAEKSNVGGSPLTASAISSQL